MLLLCGDSTNVDRPGFSPSERQVGPHLEEVFARAEGRIIVTSFASNIHRVQQVVDAAAALGRKVALVGRSMRKNVNIGRTLGHIEVPEGMMIPPHEVEDWPDHKVVVISTGSQGEPLSALRRMAYNDHRQITLRGGDTVVFSATPIPGNERAVNETVDRLYHIGCSVITPREAPIHASGHGYAEEVKLMLNLVRPRYVLPVHGDHKRIQLHAELADAVGIHPDAVFQGENGLPLEIDGSGARFGPPEQAGMIFVDGVDIGDPADVALRDRRMLSADGIFIVVATVSEQTGESVVAPEVIFRGVPFVEQADELVEEIRKEVERSLARSAEEGVREIDLHPAGAARRSRDLRLRAAAPPADGPAGRRRGLIARPARSPPASMPSAGIRITNRVPASDAGRSSTTAAAVGLRDRAHDGQTQARAAATVATAAHEALEHALLAAPARSRAPRPRRSAPPRCPSSVVAARIRVPGGVWRTAFSSRLSTSRCSSSRTPVDHGPLGADRQLVALGHRTELACRLDQHLGQIGRAPRLRRGARRPGRAAAGRRPAGASAGSSAAPPRPSRPARRRAPRSAARGWPARWSAASAARARRRRRIPAGGRACPGCRCGPSPAPRASPPGSGPARRSRPRPRGGGSGRLASRVRSISRAASVSSTIGRIARAETNRPGDQGRHGPAENPEEQEDLDFGDRVVEIGERERVEQDRLTVRRLTSSVRTATR